ncbi:MAG: hypothetical protein DRJ65_00225 [Acidobacteria bacterium]|nr:MAG: hypothetical protein DRJ65_00225 [Acidobacteriota bacterium]
MTDATAAQVLQRLESLERRIAAIDPATDWPTAEEAAKGFSVHRETLRKLAKAGKIRQSSNFPVRYYRPDLDRHFIGLVVS